MIKDRRKFLKASALSGLGMTFHAPSFKLKQPASLKRYLLEEDIQFGERVQSCILKVNWQPVVRLKLIEEAVLGIRELGKSNNQKNSAMFGYKSLKERLLR